MTDRQPESQSPSYIPSPSAGLAGIILTIGIIAIAVLDSFSTDYDARSTIAILAVLVGGIFGFDYRSGRWKGEARTRTELGEKRPPPPPSETSGEVEP